VEKRDYYLVLGLGREASEQELKSAYRQAALKFHPDRNPGSHEAEEKFKEAAEAYSVLSDPQKRAAYDRYGHAGVSASAAGNPFEGGFPDISEIFGDFFFGDLFGGGGRGRGRVQRGEDLRYDLELSFEDAVANADRMTVAVTIFALLELYKRGELSWEQAEPFGEITVRAMARPTAGGRA